jgi:hypothetical protein
MPSGRAHPAHAEVPAEITTTIIFQHPATAVFGIALLLRLVALPFATLDSGDSVARVFQSWSWMDHPFYLTEGVWAPLHYYIIAAVLWIWPDPVWAPVALHIFLGSLIPVVVYKLALELLRSPRAALLAGLAFAVYPMAILISLEAHPEVPFLLLLATGLLFLVRARRPQASSWNAAAAGLAVGLASMVRYEAWMLMPFLTLILLPRWRQAAVFLAIAIIHPLIWMTGNFIAHGDPLHSFTYASNWELNVMGNKRFQGTAFAFGRVWQLIQTTERALSFPLSLLAAAGALWCVRRRRDSAILLVPALGLFALLAFAAAHGSIWVKPAYTSTFGLLLIPCIAGFFVARRVEDWSRQKFALTAVALLAVTGVFTIEPLWQGIPHGRWLFSEAVGQFPEAADAREVDALIGRGLASAPGGLLADFMGWQATGYILLQARVHPRDICVASGATNLPVEPDAVQAFLLQHSTGVLVTRENGKLAALLKREADGNASLAGVSLRLFPVGEVKWVNDPQSPEVRSGLAGISRYTVVGAPDTKAQPPPTCDCPMSFCTS